MAASTGTRLPLARYLRLLGVQMRMSAATAMQYRVDLVIEVLSALLWTAVALVPTLVVFAKVPEVTGWTRPQALVVIAWFTLLKGVLEGTVNPSLTNVVEQVRTGTMDFVLLKPADAQFLTSTSKFELPRAIDAVSATAIAIFAFRSLGRAPAAADAALAAVLLVVAVMVLYSIWILVISASFWVVKVDNLSYLFGSLFDVGRWPSSIFRGSRVLSILFTFVFPVAVMTTFPAQALLGTLAPRTAIFAVAGGAAFAAGARQVWLRALGHYTSASS